MLSPPRAEVCWVIRFIAERELIYPIYILPCRYLGLCRTRQRPRERRGDGVHKDEAGHPYPLMLGGLDEPAYMGYIPFQQ